MSPLLKVQGWCFVAEDRVNYYVINERAPQFEVIKFSNFSSLRRAAWKESSEQDAVIFTDENGDRLYCEKDSEGLTKFSAPQNSDPTGILRIIGRTLRLAFVHEDHIIE